MGERKVRGDGMYAGHRVGLLEVLGVVWGARRWDVELPMAVGARAVAAKKDLVVVDDDQLCGGERGGAAMVTELANRE